LRTTPADNSLAILSDNSSTSRSQVSVINQNPDVWSRTPVED
jgi:hypothetical protein